MRKSEQLVDVKSLWPTKEVNWKTGNIVKANYRTEKWALVMNDKRRRALIQKGLLKNGVNGNSHKVITHNI